MTLALTVLGSSGMFATTERAASGYLVEIDGMHLWLDAGPGTWRNLLAVIDYPDIDGVIITHRHPDHTTDVFQAYHARQYGQAAPLPRIPLWAPAETITCLRGFSTELDNPFELRTIADGDEIDVFGSRVRFVSMAHPPETLGVRIELGDQVIAYSSDTGPDADLRRLASGADVFVCEATMQDSDGEWSGHMTATQAGEAASSCDVGLLLLTHLPPGRDYGLSLTEAQKVAGGVDVQLAADGLRLEL